MSVRYLAEIQRDPARAIRRQLEEMWQRVEQQAAQTARAAEQERYREAYAERHPDNSGPQRA